MAKVISCLCILAVLTTLIAPSCLAASVGPDKKPEPKFETRVFIKQKCVIAEPEPHSDRVAFVGALLTVFLPILIQKALGRAAAALKKAGDPETLKDTGRLPTYLYRLPKDSPKDQPTLDWIRMRAADGEEKPSKLELNPDFRCVIVVRGTFTKSESSTPPQEKGDDARTKLRNAGILVDELAAVYEGAVKIADDRTALQYQSRYFEVNRFQGSRSQKEKRGMVVSITLSGAGEKDGEPLLSLALINLGEVNAHTVLKTKDLETKTSSWLGGLALSDASMNALKMLDFVDPNTGEQRDCLEIMPVNIEAGFTETEDGNKALAFIGEVLEAGAEDASKAISSEILDTEKHAKEKADALEQMRQEEETAYGEYLAAQTELAKVLNPPPDEHPTPEEIAAKTFDVKRKQRVWCVKQGVLKKLGIAPERVGECPIN